MAGFVVTSPSVGVAPVPASEYSHLPTPGPAPGFQDGDARTLRNLGIFKIVCGSLMVVFQIAATALAKENLIYSLHGGGTGLWCGVIFVLCGILGLLAGRNKNKGLAIAYLVFVVLNVSLFCLVMIGVTGGEINERKWRYCTWYRIFDGSSNRGCADVYGPMVGLSSVLLILSVAIFIASVWGIISASIVIHRTNACCCYSGPSTMPAPAPIIVTTIPNSQTAGMVYTTPQNVFVTNGQPSQMYHQQFVAQPGPPATAYGVPVAGTDNQFVNGQNLFNSGNPPPYKFQ